MTDLSSEMVVDGYPNLAPYFMGITDKYIRKVHYDIMRCILPDEIGDELGRYGGRRVITHGRSGCIDFYDDDWKTHRRDGLKHSAVALFRNTEIWSREMSTHIHTMLREGQPNLPIASTADLYRAIQWCILLAHTLSEGWSDVTDGIDSNACTHYMRTCTDILQYAVALPVCEAEMGTSCAEKMTILRNRTCTHVLYAILELMRELPPHLPEYTSISGLLMRIIGELRFSRKDLYLYAIILECICEMETIDIMQVEDLRIFHDWVLQCCMPFFTVTQDIESGEPVVIANYCEDTYSNLNLYHIVSELAIEVYVNHFPKFLPILGQEERSQIALSCVGLRIWYQMLFSNVSQSFHTDDPEYLPYSISSLRLNTIIAQCMGSKGFVMDDNTMHRNLYIIESILNTVFGKASVAYTRYMRAIIDLLNADTSATVFTDLNALLHDISEEFADYHASIAARPNYTMRMRIMALLVKCQFPADNMSYDSDMAIRGKSYLNISPESITYIRFSGNMPGNTTFSENTLGYILENLHAEISEKYIACCHF